MTIAKSVLTSNKVRGTLAPPNITPHKSINNIISFLEQKLVIFASENINSTLSEEDLNQRLCIFLQTNHAQTLKQESQFIFVQAYKEEKSSRKVDIGVIETRFRTQNKAFFTIECKRLPTPAPKCREKEYIYGEKGTKYEKLGGIDRFKREHHGKGLSHSAIVAYVEKYNFHYWFKTINLWINELCQINSDASIIWNGKDLLVEQYQKDVLARYESENHRIGNSVIKLTHLWIKIHTE